MEGEIEMIGTANKTKEILRKYHLHAKKGYGQNFLTDESVLKRMIESAKLTKEDGVLEVGPGIGALTEQLAIHAKKVLCFEIDQTMIDVLQKELRHDNVEIIQQDFLKTSLGEYKEFFQGCERILVMSNLPYYITTPIIFKLLGEQTEITEMYFMVQKEVADRMTGKPKTKEYNALSVLMQYKTMTTKLFDVSREAFMPVPNVDSAVIKVLIQKADILVGNEEQFYRFIQAIFMHRRKTFVNNVISSYSVSKEFVQTTLLKHNHLTTIRSEELTVHQIAELYKALMEATQ